jgi:nucleotide-binding universal stress UspA family protein
MNLEKILVGIDFTPASLAAIRRACELAREGTVRLLHVVDTALLPHHAFIGRDLVEKYLDGLVAEAEMTIAELKRDLESSGTHVETAIRRGRPADEIIAAASGFDLVAVGAHARDVLGRLTLGSVAEEVARRSRVPTLVVRESAEGSSRVERVLLPIDVTEPCPEAIEAASTLADKLGAKLEAIHVIPWPVPMPTFHGGGALAAAQADIESRLRTDAPRAVRTLISQAIGRSASIHVATGSPAKEIIAYARPGDVIVCGTHGRGTLGRLAFGSVATKLLRGGPCPVLVVRPSEKTTEKSAASANQVGAY